MTNDQQDKPYIPIIEDVDLGELETTTAPRIISQPIERTNTPVDTSVPSWVNHDTTEILDQLEETNTSATETPVMEDIPKDEVVDEFIQESVFVPEDKKVDYKSLEESEFILNSILRDAITNSKQKTVELANDKKEIKIVIPITDADTIADSLMTLGTKMGSDNFKEAFTDPNSLPATCRDAFEHFSSQTKLSMDIFEAIKKSVEAQSEATRTLSEVLQRNVENIGVTTTRGTPSSLGKKKHLSGKEAVVTVASMMQGIKRIPLWNSGIYITLRALSLKELTAFFNSVNTSGYDYGRELGGYYFMYVDHVIKKMVLEQLLPKALQDCNYKNWRNTNKLLKVISIHDYDVILWAFASMMYREGVPIKILCTKSECMHVEEITADLTKMRFVDTSKLTPEAIAHMKDTGVKTDKDLVDYHNALGMQDLFAYKVENVATDTTTYWHFKLATANCYDYLECGAAFNAELFEFAHQPNKEEVTEFLTLNYYKAFLPWISSLECVTEAGFGKIKLPDSEILAIVDNSPEDNREAFNAILDISQMETQDFGVYATEYIKRTKITHLALQYDKCIKCDTVPDTAVDGFIPYDMQAHFFTMCLMRMLKVA